MSLPLLLQLFGSAAPTVTAVLDLLPQLRVARHGVHDDRLGVLRTSSGASTVVCAWFCITTEATHVEDHERGERKVL